MIGGATGWTSEQTKPTETVVIQHSARDEVAPTWPEAPERLMMAVGA